ncbi:MAG: alpha/beta hydrolase [Lentisphaeraceae bacterium]|nr:alpha/beta hydrolase [Lentisphaeraceae bacterium]
MNQLPVEKAKKSRLKKILILVIRPLFIVYILLCIALLAFQENLIFIPSKTLAYQARDIDINCQDLFIKSANGSTINAWYLPAQESKGTVIFCHGNAGNISHRISTLQIWNQLGYSIIAFDYQGYGKSQGNASEQNCYDDAMAVYQWLKNNNLLLTKVIIHGRSLGGGVASYLANKIPCSGLILESTFTSIPDMAQQRFPFLPTSLLTRTHFNNLQRIKKNKHPLLILHSKSDNIIPGHMGRTLFARAVSAKTFFELQGGHNEGFSITPDYEKTLDSFCRHLTKAE